MKFIDLLHRTYSVRRLAYNFNAVVFGQIATDTALGTVVAGITVATVELWLINIPLRSSHETRVLSYDDRSPAAVSVAIWPTQRH